MANMQPMRRCLVNGESVPQQGMIRFVVDPDNTVIPDVKGTLPGRGMWVTADCDMVKKAVAKQVFHKGAKRRVTIPDELPQTVGQLLHGRCLQHVSLAHRAGHIVFGRDRVKSALESEDIAVLVQAYDASPKELDKLAVVATARDIPWYRPFAILDLAHAIGRDHAVHMAIKSGGLADLFINDVNRLNTFVGATMPQS